VALPASAVAPIDAQNRAAANSRRMNTDCMGVPPVAFSAAPAARLAFVGSRRADICTTRRARRVTMIAGRQWAGVRADASDGRIIRS
jgi:hypothetical protein